MGGYIVHVDGEDSGIGGGNLAKKKEGSAASGANLTDVTWLYSGQCCEEAQDLCFFLIRAEIRTIHYRVNNFFKGGHLIAPCAKPFGIP